MSPDLAAPRGRTSPKAGASGRAASVVIADDHPPIRSLVRELLEAGGFYVCGEVADAAAAIDAAIGQAPDLCLIDVKMPGNGIAAAAAIAAMVPTTKIVMLTVSQTECDLFRAIQAGAVGYLVKDERLTGLADALWPVLEGEALLSGDLTLRLLNEFRRTTRRGLLARRRRDSVLSPREWEVLELLAEDHTTAEIAEILSIREATVRTHVSSLLRKYQVTTRQAALRKYRAE